MSFKVGDKVKFPSESYTGTILEAKGEIVYVDWGVRVRKERAFNLEKIEN